MDEVSKLNTNWNTSVETKITESVAVEVKFIPSPLEHPEFLINYLLENLSLHFIINLATVYLLCMLVIILICKLALENSSTINFKFLLKFHIFKYPLGFKLNQLLNLFVNI